MLVPQEEPSYLHPAPSSDELLNIEAEFDAVRERGDARLGTYLIASFGALALALMGVAVFHNGDLAGVMISLLIVAGVASTFLVIEGVVGASIDGSIALRASSVAIVGVAAVLYLLGMFPPANAGADPGTVPAPMSPAQVTAQD